MYVGEMISAWLATVIVALVGGVLLLVLPSAQAANASKESVAGTVQVRMPQDFSQPRVVARVAPSSVWKGWEYGQAVKLDITPAVGRLDQPATIRVKGLKPGEPVTLRASMASGYRKILWRSQATYFADAQGTVDLTRQAPRFGDYSGVHAMGLVWSMQPQNVKFPKATMWFPAITNFKITFEAWAGGRKLATATLERYFAAPGVTRVSLHEHGLVGELFLPATPGPHPAIVILGGSEGGLYPQVTAAALLASHGYAALGLGYFQGYAAWDPRLAKLPKTLVNIPLEYFIKAADWLKHQPGVDSRHVALMGWSKGAEAALVTAAMFPKAFQSVVTFMPSAYVWMGLNQGGPSSSSWTLHGKPLPWVNAVVNPAIFVTGRPVSFLSSYEAGLKDTAASARAVIPVGRIQAPVLMISASDDQIWPSCANANRIMQRLAAHQHAYADESRCYVDAGHFILAPYRPTTANAVGSSYMRFAVGGNPEAYAFADRDAWHHLLAFLHQSLQ